MISTIENIYLVLRLGVLKKPNFINQMVKLYG